jgi:hypothetical protein
MIRVIDRGESVLKLARVTIVDFNGDILLDAFVAPTLPVINYRTRVHGIQKHDLDNGNVAFFESKYDAHLMQGSPSRTFSGWSSDCSTVSFLLATLLNFI